MPPNWQSQSADLRAITNCQKGEDVDISTTDHTFTVAAKDVYVGTGGTIKFTTAGDSIHTRPFADNSWMGFAVTKIWKVGTNAANMTGAIL